MVLTVGRESVRASSSLALGWCGGLADTVPPGYSRPRRKIKVTKFLSMFMVNGREKWIIQFPSDVCDFLFQRYFFNAVY